MDFKKILPVSIMGATLGIAVGIGMAGPGSVDLITGNAIGTAGKVGIGGGALVFLGLLGWVGLRIKKSGKHKDPLGNVVLTAKEHQGEREKAIRGLKTRLNDVIRLSPRRVRAGKHDVQLAQQLTNLFDVLRLQGYMGHMKKGAGFAPFMTTWTDKDIDKIFDNHKNQPDKTSHGEWNSLRHFYKSVQEVMRDSETARSFMHNVCTDSVGKQAEAAVETIAFGSAFRAAKALGKPCQHLSKGDEAIRDAVTLGMNNPKLPEFIRSKLQDYAQLLEREKDAWYDICSSAKRSLESSPGNFYAPKRADRDIRGLSKLYSEEEDLLEELEREFRRRQKK